MITLKELLKTGVDYNRLPRDHQQNLMTLLERMARVREAWGKPMIVNDGYRKITDRPRGGSIHSWHYQGAAVDIDDTPEGVLAKWCLANLKLLASCKLFIEDPRWTIGPRGSWVHFQIYPPGSGKRVFIPSREPSQSPTFWDGKYDRSLDEKDDD